MILLDTNVVSAAMRIVPDGGVLRWLNESENSDLYLSTITIAEVSYGLQILPEGRRRDPISERFEQFVNQGFSHRVLSFDEPAAIAKTHNLVVATRNTGDFDPTGMELVNPWDA